MSWQTVRFEELYAEPSRNGVYKSKEYQGTGTPVVKMNEVFNNRRIYGGDFDLDRFQLSSEELLRFHLSINDLLFARTSVVPEGVGKCSLICSIEGDPAFESNLIRVRIDENRANPAYLFYYFQSPFGRGRILAISNGVAVRTIRGSDLKNVKIELPERETQYRIASILSAYDNLIENNRRRIQLLEQTARLLYREWFVRLRFPGHEHVAITDGVPEGWGVKPLFDIASPTYGFAFKSKLFNTDCEGVPVARIRNIPSSESQTYTTEEAPVEKLLEDGEFVIGMDGDFHMNFWTGGKTWINQRVVRIKGAGNVSDAFLRYACEKPIQDFNATIAGTTVAHLGAKHLKLIELLIPPNGILYEAQDFFDSTQAQIVALSNQSRLAKNARDLLLPRLMNGVVSV